MCLLLTLFFSPSSPITDPRRGRGSRKNMWYRVAKPSEYLAVTGYGIKDIKLARKAWILPGQSCITFDITPVNYTLEVQAVSAEERPFLMPGVFTIGPRIDNVESLRKYAQLLAPHHKLSSHVKDLVQGIIEGETGVVAASMTMEEILKGIKEFKSQVFNKVQLELNQFGLLLYHANVKQLVDVNGHEYFSCLAQKTQMVLAANQANVDVAEARMKGEAGLMLKEGQKLQNAAKVGKIYSTQRQGESRESENRMQTEVNVFKNQWEAEVVEAIVDTAINEYSHSHNHSCGQMEAPSHHHSHDHSSGQMEAPSSSCGQTDTSWSSCGQTDTSWSSCGTSSW